MNQGHLILVLFLFAIPLAVGSGAGLLAATYQAPEDIAVRHKNTLPLETDQLGLSTVTQNDLDQAQARLENAKATRDDL